MPVLIHNLQASEIPVCKLHPQQVPEKIWNKDGFNYNQCPECGLVWVNPQLTDESVAAIYATGFTAKQGKHPVYPGKLSFSEGLHFIAPYRTAKSTLLDVGTFTGHFLVAAREDGWQNVEGTEISQQAIEYARETHQLKIHEGDLLSLDLPQRTYDAITLSDVIEHVSDPAATVEYISRLLRPGGVLYMHTPHFNSIARYVYGKEWSVFFPWHRTIFTVKAMREMLERNGFYIKTLRTVGIMPFDRRSAWAEYLRQLDQAPETQLPTTSYDYPSYKKMLRNLFRPAWLGMKKMIEIPFVPLSAIGIQVGSRLVVCAEKKP